jgi:hypothetical protein
MKAGNITTVQSLANGPRCARGPPRGTHAYKSYLVATPINPMLTSTISTLQTEGHSTLKRSIRSIFKLQPLSCVGNRYRYGYRFASIDL